MAKAKGDKKKSKPAGIRTTVFGQKVVVDLFVKRGYRRSPGVNDRARAVAGCARGEDLDTRKKCFKTGGK